MSNKGCDSSRRIDLPALRNPQGWKGDVGVSVPVGLCLNKQAD